MGGPPCWWAFPCCLGAAPLLHDTGPRYRRRQCLGAALTFAPLPPLCSALGMYFDPQRQLFGEAASGRWYAYDAGTGEYTLAS